MSSSFFSHHAVAASLPESDYDYFISNTLFTFGISAEKRGKIKYFRAARDEFKDVNLSALVMRWEGVGCRIHTYFNIAI